jgi:hypothetical protein
MDGQGINGLVIGSSQESPDSVPVKIINARTWTSVVQCISAIGISLDPLSSSEGETAVNTECSSLSKSSTQLDWTF